MKHEPETRTNPAFEPPSAVIHDEFADETLLARWLRRGMEKGPKFWGLALGTVAVGGVVLYLANALSQADPAVAKPWEALAKAKDADDRLKVAEEYPKSPAASWARLQVAGLRFHEGVDKLTTDREAAGALLRTAGELYREVGKATDKDAPQARLAALGEARTLEARNELKDAIEQYRKVADTWPDSDEGKQAARLADVLKRPESAKFYEQLYAYKAPTARMPGGGRGLFDSLLPKGHPRVNGAMPDLDLDLPTGPIRVPEADSKTDDAPKLPDNPFAPDTPKDE